MAGVLHGSDVHNTPICWFRRAARPPGRAGSATWTDPRDRAAAGERAVPDATNAMELRRAWCRCLAGTGWARDGSYPRNQTGCSADWLELDSGLGFGLHLFADARRTPCRDREQQRASRASSLLPACSHRRRTRLFPRVGVASVRARSSPIRHRRNKPCLRCVVGDRGRTEVGQHGVGHRCAGRS